VLPNCGALLGQRRFGATGASCAICPASSRSRCPATARDAPNWSAGTTVSASGRLA
jgi:hypothetical protein